MLKEKIEKAKNVVFPVTGGIGRNIFFTGVIKNFKKQYPDKKLFVVAGTPEVFFNNPKITRVYGFSMLHHFYEDYVHNNAETVILEVEPYRHPSYLAGEEHIVRCWCDLLEIECEDIVPELFFTRNEREMAEAHMKKQKKPTILLQHVGGKLPDHNEKQDQISSLSSMYRRNLRDKVVQEVVDQLIEDGYQVSSVQGNTQFCPDKAEKLFIPIRALMALIPYVSGAICIDSFLQHATAALGVPSLVLWAGTNPQKLGYGMHKNLRRAVCSSPECHRPNSYAFDVQPNGMLWDCPFNDACIDYESKTIIEGFKEMKGEEYANCVKNFVSPEQKKEIKENCDKCK